MRRSAVAALVVVVVLLLVVVAGCSDADDGGQHAPAGGRAAVVVASFDFAESELLAELYAQALEDEGIPVDRQLRLGPRELLVPAMRQGFVDVVPEYAGSALDAAGPSAAVDRSDPAAVAAALAAAVRPWGFLVLRPSSASNQNALAVTDELAAEHQLAVTTDLRDEAPSLVLGGPPECPERSNCLLGLADVYGLRFERFVPLAGSSLVRQALDDGVVDVGVLFTTDAALAGEGMTVLRDDRELQPAENVVPLVRASVLDGTVRAALDEVSAALTTTNLRFLNWRVANAGTSVTAEARAWLDRRGLLQSK